MNTTDLRIRRVGVVMIVLFVALFVNVNYLQVVRAKALSNDPNNRRYLIRTYGAPRGQILSSDRQVLARSEDTNDDFVRQRVYPATLLTSHVVGYLSALEGATGLEDSQAHHLLGDDARTASNLVDYFLGKPQPGAVRITIDTRVQDAARRALGAQTGAVAALNPKTGAVYALWSNPSYDPNPIASHNFDAARAAVKALDDGARPGVARAFQDTYPPGSTFKVVTAAAALQNGITPEATYDNPPVLELPDSNVGLRNFGGGTCRADAGGRVSFRGGFVQSCNTTFAQIGLQLGPDKMFQQAQAFGLNVPPPLEVSTAASVFPAPPGFEGARSSLAQAAIGQFDVRVTPLQMAMVAGAVANNGTLVRPYLVAEVFDGKGRQVSVTHPRPLAQALSPDNAKTLKDFMVAVVAGGTGTAGQIPNVTVGGKTGTAQHAEGQPPHAWFIAFAPAEDPVVAVAVVVENGGSLGSDATGGQVAAPVAREVMQAVLTLKPDAGG